VGGRRERKRSPESSKKNEKEGVKKRWGESPAPLPHKEKPARKHRGGVDIGKMTRKPGEDESEGGQNPVGETEKS